MSPTKVVFVFIDGLGMGGSDPAHNPIVSGIAPYLHQFMATAKPIDACLGVPGIPQSATGQTALLTGINAAREVGRHIEGFPGPALREIIETASLFRQLNAIGCRGAFANAYFVEDTDEVRQWKRASVTTIAALSGLGTVRNKEQMRNGNAVYQDLTRASLRSRGYDGPLLSPSESAAHLAAVAREYDVTLFEYFQTDRAGHRGDRTMVENVLAQLNAFLEALLPALPPEDYLFLLTSDHGNIEDLRTPLHTQNPVPLVAIGRHAERMRAAVSSIVDITPAMIAILTEERLMLKNENRDLRGVAV